jgi:hypothetical protein
MPLRKVAEITLGEDLLDVAKGDSDDDFHLVRSEGNDAYGRPVARVVKSSELVSEGNDDYGTRRVGRLVVLLGQALEREQALKAAVARETS